MIGLDIYFGRRGSKIIADELLKIYNNYIHFLFSDLYEIVFNLVNLCVFLLSKGLQFLIKRKDLFNLSSNSYDMFYITTGSKRYIWVYCSCI